MEISNHSGASGFDTGAKPSSHRHRRVDATTLWTRLLLAALMIQLAVALWVLLDASPSAAPISSITIALAAPIAGLVVAAFSDRQRCAIWSTGPLAMLWIAQTALLLSWQACDPITLAIVCGFGAAVLMFVVCPMAIWPIK